MSKREGGMMACWMIHTVSGLEFFGHEGCADVQASTRFCTVLGSFLRVSLGRFEPQMRCWAWDWGAMEARGMWVGVDAQSCCREISSL